MKNLVILGLFALTACNTGPVKPPVEEPPVVVPTPALPVPNPTPGIPGAWWKPGTIKSFQIFHFDGLSEFKSKLKAGTQVVNLELDQIEEAGGKILTDYAHSKGVKVIAYTSSGYEKWRDDAGQFPSEAMGGKICKSDSCLTWWEGEKWAKPLYASFFAFHAKRADRAKAVGADAIEFDNMDWAWNKVGYTISKAQNLEAVLKLITLGHARGLAVFAKNTPDLAKELAPHADGVLIEECNDNDECRDYMPYTGKPILMLEYSTSCAAFAGSACNKQDGYFK